MSEKKVDDGGQAFPKAYAIGEGLTLRDYFAASYLSGVVANPYWSEQGLLDEKSASEISYKYADAMIEARKK